jgi:hypothetical protein
MNRRQFTQAAVVAPLAAQAKTTKPFVNQSKTLFNALYFRAHMYTCVPRHIREDLKWMADIGTNIVSLSVLEQDLFAAVENIEIVCNEAEKVGIQVFCTPSRWGGLTAGAPKCPSLFSVNHPQTWMLQKDGSPVLNPKVSGVISSVHYPETYEFFCTSLDMLFKLFPIKGITWDEPKGFREDYSPKAVERLGKDAPKEAHWQATADFYERVSQYIKEKYPDKTVQMFTQVHNNLKQTEIAARIKYLDYFGADGRPWDLATDSTFKGGEDSESGKGKTLLDKAPKILEFARKYGKKTLLLSENHNMTEAMYPAMDAGLPKVLAMGLDQLIYYYYPRNIQKPEVNMGIIAKHLKAYGGRQK